MNVWNRIVYLYKSGFTPKNSVGERIHHMIYYWIRYGRYEEGREDITKRKRELFFRLLEILTEEKILELNDIFYFLIIYDGELEKYKVKTKKLQQANLSDDMEGYDIENPQKIKGPKSEV